MDPRNLRELAPFLQDKGLSPKKSLSQNFLIDKNILDKIVKTANILPGEEVCEIGPGPGALTLTLLEAGAHVLAIEMDNRFASLLPELCNGKTLEIIHGNVLDFSFSKKLKVVSNIPYHITSDILEKLAKQFNLFPEIFLTVQKEWADRINNTKKATETALQVFLHTLYEIRSEFIIPASCFWPRPHIDSTFISFKAKSHENDLNTERYYLFLEELYKQKRKMIRATHPNFCFALSELGILETSRPEKIPLDLFLPFFHLVNKAS